MKPIKMYLKHFKHPAMSNSVQLIILLAVTTAISLIFYLHPFAQTTNGSVILQNSYIPYNGSGIGGGDITGNCMAGKRALPIYSVDTNSKCVSLSFDAAWGADDTIQILDILDRYNVKVTFFMTGGWVENFPDMVKEIHRRGHDLGNHSENHKHMSKLSASEQREEINKVSQRVKELTGYDMFLFRPPYGDFNTQLINTIYSLNYYPIQWSVDSLDWKDYGVNNIIKRVTTHKALSSGAIILMHNGAKYTAAALESVITTLQSQGYTLIPISELIIRDNFHMDNNGTQLAD